MATPLCGAPDKIIPTLTCLLPLGHADLMHKTYTKTWSVTDMVLCISCEYGVHRACCSPRCTCGHYSHHRIPYE